MDPAANSALPPDASPKEQVIGTDGRLREKLVLQIRELLEAGQLEAALTRFNQLHPADQGAVLVELALEGRKGELLDKLPPDVAAEVLEHLDPEEAVEVSEGVAPPVLSRILDETSPDVAADILQELPEERSREVLRGMHGTDQVTSLLEHPEDSAGGVMIPGYPALPESVSAGNALDRIRLLSAEDQVVHTLFVVNQQQKVIGSLNVTQLALARPSALVGELADREVISVREDTDQEECARLMQRYNLGRLPVVDAEGRLKGVIVAEDIVDVMAEEATEDMYRMAGLLGERVFGPLTASLRSRLPWLFLNVATVFLAAWVIGLFETTIGRLVVLAAFLPVVAGQGGIGGTQAVTLVVRSMALAGAPAPGHAPAGAGTGAWPDKWRVIGVGRRTAGSRLARHSHAGHCCRDSHAGQHAGSGSDRSGRAAADAASGPGPGGILRHICDHLHRRGRLHHVIRLGHAVPAFAYVRSRPLSGRGVRRPARLNQVASPLQVKYHWDGWPGQQGAGEWSKSPSHCPTMLR